MFASARALLFGLALCPAAIAAAPATVQISPHGIPHIRADSLESAGKGYGYVFADQNMCALLEELITARGERTLHFGREATYDPGLGDPIANLDADFVHRLLIPDADVARYRAARSPQLRALEDGFAAGVDKRIGEEGGDVACDGFSWQGSVAPEDMSRLYRKQTVALSGLLFAPFIAAAGTPGEQAAADIDALATPEYGSNAIAIGDALAANGRGLLFGNPHLPWAVPWRFHQVHLTVPGELDVMGAARFASPVPAVGYNRDVAWSLTVSTAKRGTITRLPLDPDNPDRYLLAGRSTPFEERAIRVPLPAGEGGDGFAERRYRQTALGPVIALPLPAPDPGAVMVLADVNAHNDRQFEQFLDLSMAGDTEEILQSLRRIRGMSRTNTIAVDRHGAAVIADISAVPDLPSQIYARCVLSEISGQIIVDGSQADCLWNHPRRDYEGMLLDADAQPVLVRRDYVANSNDSHWVFNADAATFLTGFSPVVGDERTIRFERTRASLAMLRELRETEGTITAEALEDMFYAARNIGAELVVPDLLAACASPLVENLAPELQAPARTACGVLARWDLSERPTAVGAMLFREFQRSYPWYEPTKFSPPESFWRVPFEPDRPVDTPAGVAEEELPNALRILAETAQMLAEEGFDLEAPLGEYQYVRIDDERLPIGGGNSFKLHFSEREPGIGYTDPVEIGSSYIQIVGFEDDGPVARTLLTYGQSSDPENPHSSDQLRLYAAETLIDQPFRPEDIGRGEGWIEMTVE